MKIKISIAQLELKNFSKEKQFSYIEKASANGSDLIIFPELQFSPYFCQKQDKDNFTHAIALQAREIKEFCNKAKECNIFVNLNFFEKEENNYYNSMIIISNKGEIISHYRKIHIPDGPGYQEKYYFKPGNLGFKIFEINGVKIGGAICWDQWFPESARSMALLGADLCFYPTAIGSEPENPNIDTCPYWQRAMQGHAISNIMPIIAVNRIGDENGQVFYGSSFFTDQFGNIILQASKNKEELLCHEYDVKEIRKSRAEWGFFRDRQASEYQLINKK